jgi:hypothetical protein
MAFVVLYDASVLYPAPLRDLLVRVANTGVVRARWSTTILDECFRNLLQNRPELNPEALQRTRVLTTPRRRVPPVVTNAQRNARKSPRAASIQGNPTALSAADFPRKCDGISRFDDAWGHFDPWYP